MNIFAYLLSIVVANVLVALFGMVSIGPLVFPAGAVVVGFTFTLRDMVQRRCGKHKVWGWMLVATLLSALFSGDVALASGVAFIASEAVDWAVFTFSGGSFRRRVLLSNAIGAPLDSLIFVPLVFGWFWPAIVGQAIVKVFSSFLILAVYRNDK